MDCLLSARRRGAAPNQTRSVAPSGGARVSGRPPPTRSMRRPPPPGGTATACRGRGTGRPRRPRRTAGALTTRAAPLSAATRRHRGGGRARTPRRGAHAGRRPTARVCASRAGGAGRWGRAARPPRRRCTLVAAAAAAPPRSRRRRPLALWWVGAGHEHGRHGSCNHRSEAGAAGDYTR